MLTCSTQEETDSLLLGTGCEPEAPGAAAELHVPRRDQRPTERSRSPHRNRPGPTN